MENNKIWKFETLDDAVGVINARKKIESALIYNPNELIAPELLQIDELDEIVNFYPDTFEVEYQQERFVDINELEKRFFEDSDETTMCDCCDEYYYGYDLATFNIAADNGNYNTKVCDTCHGEYVKYLSAEDIKEIVENDLREALDDDNAYEQHYRIKDGEVLKLSQYIIENLDVEYLRANNQINAGAYFFKEEAMEVLEADPNVAILSVMHEF